MDHAAAFKALGDPKRVGMLRDIAACDDVCACDLLERYDMSQSTLSHHLGLLARAGLVRTRKQGKWVHYTADRDALRELAGVLAGVADTPGGGGCGCV